MRSASVIAFQAAVMFILLFAGWFLYKKKFLCEQTVKQLSDITITIINPIVIFCAYQTDFDRELVKGLLYSLLLALAAHGIFILAGILTIRAGRSPSEGRSPSDSSERYRIERFALSYSNCAFMGIPLVEATFGSEGVFYLTGFITVFNLLTWTHGVILMSGGEKKPASERAAGLLKIVLSPAIIAIILGMACFFTGLRLPRIIQIPLDYLGSMNTPLAMIVSGATIAKAGLLDGFKKARVYYVQAFKLIVVPVLLAALFVPLRLFGVSPVVINVVLIAAAAPTASITIMFSYKYGRDAEYAANQFSVSTVLSVLTLPAVMLVSELLAGLLIP